MDNKEKIRADQHDHNNHLPKDVLNAAQDPNSFRDPLEQELKKQKTNATPANNNDKPATPEK